VKKEERSGRVYKEMISIRWNIGKR